MILVSLPKVKPCSYSSCFDSDRTGSTRSSVIDVNSRYVIGVIYYVDMVGFPGSNYDRQQFAKFKGGSQFADFHAVGLVSCMDMQMMVVRHSQAAKMEHVMTYCTELY